MCSIMVTCHCIKREENNACVLCRSIAWTNKRQNPHLGYLFWLMHTNKLLSFITIRKHIFCLIEKPFCSSFAVKRDWSPLARSWRLFRPSGSLVLWLSTSTSNTAGGGPVWHDWCNQRSLLTFCVIRGSRFVASDATSRLRKCRPSTE